MVSENESELSPTTGEQMANIGFVEKTDNEKIEMIKFLVDSAKGINTSKINKEENLMAKSTKNTVEEIVEKSDIAVETEKVAPVAEDEVTKASTCPDCKMSMDACKCDSKADAETEKAAKPKTGEESAAHEGTESTDVEAEEDKKKPMAPKSDEVVAEAITETTDSLEKAFSDLLEIVKSLQSEVELLKSTKVDIEVAQTSFEAVAKDIASATSVFNEFGKRVELVEQDTAFRKSGDLGEIVQNQPETVEKSLWGGSFLKTADLFS
jgi:hypothetical protein